MCIRQDRHGRAVVAMSSEKEGAAVVESTHWHASEVSKPENKKKTPIPLYGYVNFNKEKWRLRGFQSSANFFGGPEFGRSYIRTSRRRPPLMVSANLDPKLS